LIYPQADKSQVLLRKTLRCAGRILKAAVGMSAETVTWF
jgi:hypothetical protein